MLHFALKSRLEFGSSLVVVVVVVVDVVLTLEKTLCETIAGRPSLDAYL